MTFSSFNSNVNDLFVKLGWRKLSTQRPTQKAIMVFISLHGLTPGYLSDQFTNHNDITNYSLRDSLNKLAVPLPCTNLLKTVLVIVVQYFGTAYLMIYSKQNHLTISFINLIPVPLFNNFSNMTFM